MSSLTHILKALFIPLTISLALYTLLIHLLLPFLRRNRQLYTSYLPLSSTTSTTPTFPLSSSSNASATTPSTLRTALINLLLPAALRRRFQRRTDTQAEDADSLFDDEEGEGMIGFDDPVSERRREALEQRRSVGGFEGAVGFMGSVRDEGGGRLSRELEEGFRDESESESEDGDEEVGRGRWFG